MQRQVIKARMYEKKIILPTFLYSLTFTTCLCHTRTLFLKESASGSGLVCLGFIELMQMNKPRGVSVDESTIDHKGIHLLYGCNTQPGTNFEFWVRKTDPIALSILNLLDGFAAAVEHLHLKNGKVAEVKSSKNVNLQ